MSPPRTRTSLTRRGAMHPVAATLVALAVSVVAAVLIALPAGPHRVGQLLGQLQPGWLALAAVCELVSLASYAGVYQPVVLRYGGQRLTCSVNVRLVVAGFGAFAVVGGFALDRRALQLLGAERRRAVLSVLALGLFELAVLAPAALVAAVVLLMTGARVNGSMLWPWAMGVPLGLLLATAFVLTARRRRRSPMVEHGLATVAQMLKSWRSSLATTVGIAFYFAADLAVLGLALRAVDLRIAAGPLIIAYASGYLLTRRTLPLGGAGFVEVLMTLSLHWVGQPLAPALVGVIAYRALNFLFVAALALITRLRLRPAAIVAAVTLED